MDCAANRIAELEVERDELVEENGQLDRGLIHATKDVERLRGLLNEWAGQHASAGGLLADTKAALTGTDPPE